MAYIVRMPKMGVEMQTGILVDWHIEEGTPVAQDDVLAEIESEKTTTEITARESGLLRQRILREGDEVPPGTAMGIVADADTSIDDLVAEIEEKGGHGETDPEQSVSGQSASSHGSVELSGERQSESVRATPKARQRASELGLRLSEIEGSGPKGAVTQADVSATEHGDARTASDILAGRSGRSTELVTPRARKQASELGVDVTQITGSGPHGAIRADDVTSSPRASGQGLGERPESSDERPGRVDAGRTIIEERTLSGMRSTIARRLSQSWDAPHVTVHRHISAEGLLRRTAESEDVVSITDVLLKFVSDTLCEFPAFNATYEDETHRLYEEHNIGFAVDVEQGLVTPVLRDVESMTVAEIAYERGTLTERVKNRHHYPEDLQGGTFTVSNLGVFGVDSFTPIINPPEVAILGINAIREDPHRTETGFEFRRTIGFSLSFDHRVIDGADAAKFLQTLATRLETTTTDI